MKGMKSTLMTAVILLLASGCLNSERSSETDVQTGRSAGIVLQPDQGEVLLLRRPGSSEITIKVDPVTTGSRRVAMGTQELNAGYGIPVHRHENEDEILFVHEGVGTALLGNEEIAVEPGTTIYIPQGIWHGLDNTGDGQAKIIWVVAPPGLEEFFREIGAPPEEEAPPLSPQEMEQISRAHGLMVKTER